MHKLLIKIMSKEQLADSDPRKLFTLIPVPPECHVEFRRGSGETYSELVLQSIDTNSASTLIPLIDCGNVYVLQEGKTVSSFNPEPFPTMGAHVFMSQGDLEITSGAEALSIKANSITLQGPGLTTGVAKSSAAPIDNDYLNHLSQILNLFTSGMRVSTQVNDSIVEQACKMLPLEATSDTGVGIYVARDQSIDDASMDRYFNRVRDAFLNCTPRFTFDVTSAKPRYCLVFKKATSVQTTTGVITPPEHYAEFKNAGLILNMLQRGVSLYGYGARTLYLFRPLLINDSEREAIKAYFKKELNVSVVFKQQGDKTLALEMNPILS